ncbi:MAG: Ig-like domain-containing protein, partial [bacterium]|nr:Ig-like domain-containing protein [bacterium]
TGNTSVELVPGSTLAGNKQYVVFVKDTVSDLAGNALAAPVTITFTTIDNVKPTVLSITPPTPESGDSGPPVFTVTFSEPIDESEFDEQNIAFLKDGTPAPYSYIFGEGSMTVVITPDALVDNSTYSVTVQNADDMAGNTQTAVYTMDFFTPDTIAPQLAGLEFDPGLNVSVGEPVTATAEIAANDAEDVAKVYFYINGELKHTDETSPYSYLFNAPIMGGTGSTFTVEAYAEDAAANRSSLSAVVALGDYSRVRLDTGFGQ